MKPIMEWTIDDHIADIRRAVEVNADKPFRVLYLAMTENGDYAAFAKRVEKKLGQ